MKTKRTVLAACIATLFISGTVFAKDTWEYHESGWNNVNSYGKVAIAQDSVSQWGPWEDFVEPAAGAPSPVAMPGAVGSDPYRTIPTTVVANDVCRSGDWCGYAVFRNYEWNYNHSEENEGSVYTRPMAGLFALTLTPDDPNAVTVDGGSGSGKVSWRLASLTDTPPTFTNSGADAPASFGNWYWWYNSEQGLHNFQANRETSTSSGNTSTYDRTYAYGYPHDYYYYYGLPTSNKEVAVGWFERYVESYVRGEGESSYWDKGTETYGYYVAGIATPQAYLDSQRAGNVVATYSGASYDWWSGYQTPVNMTVDFRNASWSGSWNGGSDGNVYTGTDSKGNQFWYGQVGFNASGNISGANIQSTSLSANDGAVTGKVQGTFFGQTAGSIGGVSDIVKTKTVSGGNEALRATTLTVIQPTTVTAPHTAVFLVNKVDNTPR